MDIAQAYVQILPSTDGIQQNLTTALSDAGTSAGQTAGSRIGGALATGLKVGGAAIGAAVAAGAAAVGTLATQAVNAYGSFEQLAGGVEKLFGEKAAQTVQRNADQAFKTAGMSANEYMETVTGFSASLIKSVGGDTAKAAELADLAIRDMSDNVNVFGSDMESVQYAYSGFARGNFTMLDNLKLGFAGTKEGMQELLDTATELTGVEYDINSYADIVEAIHAVQEAQNIAGTTAKEAAGTIQGSLASTKSAWENLVIAFGKGDDLTQPINDLVESATNVVDNIIPIFEKALEGIGQFVEKIAPIIAEKLPALIETLLPSLIDAATSLVGSLASALPEIITGLLTILPNIIETGMQMAISLFQGFADTLPTMIPQIVSVITTIVETLTNPDNLINLLDAALAIILALVEGLINSIPIIIESLPKIIDNIIEFFIKAGPKIAEAGQKLLSMLVENLPGIIASISAAVPQIISSIVTAVGKGVTALANAGYNLLVHIGDKFGEVGTWIMERVKAIPSAMLKGIQSMIESFKNVGKNLIAGVWNGFVEKWNSLKENVQQWGNNFIGFVNAIFGNASPSKKFKKIGGYLSAGLAIGIEDNAYLAEDAMSELGDSVTSAIGTASMSVGMTAYAPRGQVVEVPRQYGSGQQTAVLMLDKEVLGRVVYTLNQANAARVGVNLAGGVA